MPLRPSIRIALALALPLSCACQRLERAEECRSVWKAVNPVLQQIDVERRAKPEDARTYESIAARYMLLSGSLAQLTFTQKKLGDPVVEYRQLLQEASRDARTFAEALTSKDQTRISLARLNATRSIKRENLLVTRIDSTCRGR
jgi:hypothetical protein